MWVMVPSEDIEFEGNTTFGVGASSYQYAVALKNGRLSVHLVENVSKKGWYTGGLDEGDCITPGNEISGASAADYAKIFRDALEADLTDSEDVKRKLEASEDGALKLELVVNYHVLHSSRKAKYEFTLNPVSRERIDALESTLVACQKRIEVLELQTQPENAQESSTGICTPCCVLLKAESKMAESSFLRWTVEESDQRVVTVNDAVVKVLHQGMYVIGIVASRRSDHEDIDVELKKNGESLCLTDYCGAVNAALHLAEGDELSFASANKLMETSTLSIAYLGN